MVAELQILVGEVDEHFTEPEELRFFINHQNMEVKEICSFVAER